MADILRQSARRQFDQYLNLPFAAGVYAANPNPLTVNGVTVPTDGYVVIDGVRPADNDGRGFMHDAILPGPNLTGEAIVAGSPVYRRASDGLWYVSQATSAGTAESDNVIGWAASFTPIGDLLAVVKIWSQWGYSEDLNTGSPNPRGKQVYLSINKSSTAYGSAGNVSATPAFATQKPAGLMTDGKVLIAYPFVFQNAT